MEKANPQLVKKVLRGLNPSQREGVIHGEGPCLIIAGAGTGKTTVITRRIAYLIVANMALADEILALTFTEKAAMEMEERVDILVPYGYTNVWISTFHAFSDRVLRENALELGLSSDIRVLTRAEQVIFFREHLFEFPLSYYRPLGDPTRYIQAMITLFSRAKDEDVSSREYLAYAKQLEERSKTEPENKEQKELAIQQMEIALTYSKYQELLVKEGKIDFGDQISLTLRLFREHPAILRRYQERFKYILVDEFQDTNYAQLQLVNLLASLHKNITVVGDDDQCLPPGTLISTPEGKKKIEGIQPGDEVITAVGKGYASTSKVLRVFRNKKHIRFLTFGTEKGYKVKVTANHKMFCFVPPVPEDKGLYYVYLMWREDLGWRLGTTNDLAGRLRLERSADKILGIRCLSTEVEAKYFENLLSLKYGIPTVCFMERKGVSLTGEWLQRLYQEIDTDRGVKLLASDLGIDLSAHHYCLAGVNRGGKSRIKINLTICYRKYSSKSSRNTTLRNPGVLHLVSLETSDEEVIKRLKEVGIPCSQAKKGVRVRIAKRNLEEAGAIAKHLQILTGGILECRFALGTLNTQHRPALVMPASNVLIGLYLPILDGCRVIYDKVVKISEEVKNQVVYDLEVDRTHNFIADGVVVHNSIYKFRGAAISNILGFMDTYKEARQIVLSRNYRSTQSILDSSYRLILHNNPDRLEVRNRIDKQLVVSLKDKGETRQVVHLHYDTISSEADGVAKLIRDKVSNSKYHYSDFAILVRSNKDADPYLRSLNMYGIPWYFTGTYSLYDQQEIQLLIAFLRCITDLSDSPSLFCLATGEIYQMRIMDLLPLMNYATRKNLSLYYVFTHPEEVEHLEISKEGVVTAEKIVADISHFAELATKRKTGEVLYEFLMHTGYLKRLTSSNSSASEEKIKNIARFFDIVRGIGNILSHDRVFQFVNYLGLLIEAGDNPEAAEIDAERDCVRVLTVHAAKGLEFRIVFLVSLVSDRFPTRERKEPIPLPDTLVKDILPLGDFHLQEERRLFYVGMTRAKEELYLTSSTDYGGKRKKRISRFVLEALNLPKAEAEVEVYKPSLLEVIERNAPPAMKDLEPYSPIPESEVLNLSYFQIDDYLTCPLKYKFIHILRVPLSQHHRVIYGKALHDAVCEYNKRKVLGQPVTCDDLIKVFESSWISEGFLSREHEKQRLEIGKATLHSFFMREEMNSVIPTYVEREFSSLIDRDRITGRWDRVDNRDGEITIIDFKSSDIIRDEKRAAKAAKESLQLSIYALAYYKIFSQIPKVELHFLESGLKGEAKRNEEDFIKTQEKIKEASSGIRSRDYSPRPSYHACNYCAYEGICPGER